MDHAHLIPEQRKALNSREGLKEGQPGTYLVQVVVDNVELGGLTANVLRIGDTVEVNLVENGVLRALPAVLHAINAVVEHLTTNTTRSN